jgi:hypothetical protein
VVEEESDPDGDFTEEVFDTVMLTVPFTFLFILLHVWVLSIIICVPEPSSVGRERA